ncbi:MAG: alkyl hydroperoxide reductase [Methylibium sp. NZG]|nr:MAG: alkyl hydroperoxide reductase [Methylibium sp. NZG]
MDGDAPVIAPELQVSRWFNTTEPITLPSLRGRVVLLHAFQMLCPACVSHGLPQAQRVHRLFPREQVAVVGLHTVFEHHAAMGPDALAAFIHEYRWPFPIGVDLPAPQGGVPTTMGQLALRGTPSLVLLDREGAVRMHHFGAVDDLALGAVIGQLLAEPA